MSVLLSLFFFSLSLPLILKICVTGFPHDIRPCQRHGAYHEPDWYDAAAVSLGWLSAVSGSHAARLPPRLLGHQEQDGGKWIIYESDSLQNVFLPKTRRTTCRHLSLSVISYRFESAD